MLQAVFLWGISMLEGVFLLEGLSLLLALLEQLFVEHDGIQSQIFVIIMALLQGGLTLPVH